MIAIAPDVLLLSVNLLLAAGCLGLLVAVVVAAHKDRRERRRWRRMVPDAWPPAGADLKSPAIHEPARKPRVEEEIGS